jgi:soluble P-type ATPase
MNNKPGIEIAMPHFAEPLRMERVVCDYTGTLACGGKLVAGVTERLRALMERVEVDVVTSDTRGTAHAELAAVPLEPRILAPGKRHDVQKRNYANKWKPARIAAIGNGNNDVLLLRTVRLAGGLAIAVDNGEGCAVRAMQNASVFVVGMVNALELLLDPVRLVATLRR